MTSDNLRLGERALRDNVPIRFNELSEKSSKTHADDLPKHMTVKVAIRTEYFGITGNAKAKSGDCSVGYKCFRKLDHIQDNPRSVIKAWQQVFTEVLVGKPEPDPIMAVEIFQSFLTGTATKEFERILHKVAWRLFECEIQVKFNSRICQFTNIDYANAKKSHGELVKADTSEELLQAAAHLRSWIQKNDNRKEQREKVKATAGLKPYAWTWPPTKFPPPPSKPTHGIFFAWADSGINATSACAWLRIHNHGWEFGDLFQREIFLEVQKLAFKSYGEKAGRTQIDYLSEDLVIEGTIKLSKFYSLVEAHSEAQPYFPPIEGDTEIGKVFSDERKTRILWQAAHEPFKDELTNLHITKYDDLESWEHAQEKFLLAEERRDAKLSLSKAGKKKPAHSNTSSKPKNHQNKKDGKPPAKLDHTTSNRNHGNKSYQNRKGGGGGRDDHHGGKASNTKKRKGTHLSYEEWMDRDRKQRARYDQYVTEHTESQSDNEVSE